jgi:hypothetical protein
MVGLTGRAAVLRIIRRGTTSPKTAALIENATTGAVTALEVLFADKTRWRLAGTPQRCGYAVELVA